MIIADTLVSKSLSKLSKKVYILSNIDYEVLQIFGFNIVEGNERIFKNIPMDLLGN